MSLHCHSVALLYLSIFLSCMLGFLDCMTLFSTMVLQPVACGMAESRSKWLIFSLAPYWAIAFIFSFEILIPEANGVQYIECIACFPGCLEGTIRVISLTRFSYSLLILNIVPLLLCICIPLGTLCYIKRHPIAEGDKHSFLAKFAAFLISGNFLTVLAHVVAAIVATVSRDIVGMYVGFSIVTLTFIPTPILIVVFLKPVRKQLRRLFCSKCRKDNEAVPMQQAETPPQQFEMQPL